MAILSRVAENLFWVGRYAERAISVARLINATAQLELDAGEELEEDLWTPLVGVTAGELPGHGRKRRETSAGFRRYLGFDGSNPNSLSSCVSNARNAAREVRENLSSETWEQLNRLHLDLQRGELMTDAEDRPHEFFRRTYERLALFQGLVDSTLARDETWNFLSLGAYLERASNIARTVRIQSHLLVTIGEEDEAELARWTTVLRSCGSVEAYARYYSMRVDPPRVLEFLLLNPVFPQSLRYSLNAGWRALVAVAGEQESEQPGPAVRTLGRLRAQIDLATIDEIVTEGFEPFLEAVGNQIAATSDAITLAFFRKQPLPGPGAVARAAMILASSQQQ